MSIDHGPLCATGVRCPDCGWPIPPEHDAAIAARALREAGSALLEAAKDANAEGGEFTARGLLLAAEHLAARAEAVGHE